MFFDHKCIKISKYTYFYNKKSNVVSVFPVKAVVFQGKKQETDVLVLCLNSLIFSIFLISALTVNAKNFQT